MNLKNRLAKVEKNVFKVSEVTFLGWADCEWKEAEGQVRARDEPKEEFFERVKSITDKKLIWCY